MEDYIGEKADMTEDKFSGAEKTAVLVRKGVEDF
jgi:hypothetical protein